MDASKEDMILEELRQIRATQLQHIKDVADIRSTQVGHVKDIATLKVKTGVWSALVSAVVALSAVVLKSW